MSAPGLTKVGRHLRWAREQGLRRLIEEDQLDPRERARGAWAKHTWRRQNPLAAGLAVPVFVVGLQRSGTNMLLRGLEQAGEVEVRNENDRRAFDRFRLRDDDRIRALIRTSRHRFILFKPLCDSHRVRELLDLGGSSGTARAIWVHRRVDDRVRSSVAKFGAGNLVALKEIAAGRGAGLWQAGGLTEADLDLLRSFDWAELDPASGSALFWYLRNKLVIELGLGSDPRVTVVSYDRFLADPEPAMRALCARIGLDHRPAFVAGFEPGRSPARPPLALHPRVRSLCDDLQPRLDALTARSTTDRR